MNHTEVTILSEIDKIKQSMKFPVRIVKYGSSAEIQLEMALSAAAPSEYNCFHLQCFVFGLFEYMMNLCYNKYVTNIRRNDGRKLLVSALFF